MTAKISEEEKERRWQELMDLQSVISRKKNEALIGSIQRVMIGTVDPDSQKPTGRTQAHAPEVDGVVYVGGGTFEKHPVELAAGEMVEVKITGALDYDLIGEINHGN
jgi:ribosomal protein S12 methylthiotransferase